MSIEPKSARTPPIARANPPAQLKGRLFLLLAPASTASVFLAALYAYVFVGSDPQTLLQDEIAHVAMNVTAVWVVGVVAYRVRGLLDHKLRRTLSAAFITFAIFFLLILVGRWYFSRPLLLSSFCAAVAVGASIVLLKHKFSGPRVAIIAPLTDCATPKVEAAIVNHSADDLRSYDILLVTLREGLSAEWAAALSRAMLAGSKVRHLGEYEEEVRGAVSLDHFDLDHISAEGISSYRFAKRLLDIAIVLFVLPLGIPLLVLGAVMVFLTMGGPVFFVQERVGLGGKVFRMWKLRTMHAPAPNADASATSVGDARITKVGGFLRRFRIDELPQLFHVLMGEMSLVGPRPEQPALAEDYERQLPHFAYRHLVRPGITGWAQVRAAYAANLSETQTKLSYDLYYVKKVSPLLDMQILVRTFWILSSGGGVR